MDLNYNILKLDEILDELFNKFKGKKNNKKLKQLIDDILSKNDLEILSKKERESLNNYSKETISLMVEKKILLAIENKSLVNRKSYWLALKDRAPKISKNILSHYYDYFIEDINNKFVRYKTRTIDEINKTYDKEIGNSLNSIDQNLSEALSNVSNINLDHMENLNSNGRVLSVDGVRKGGLFLSKDSNISYGKFVNKDEFINMIDKLESSKFKVSNGEISKEDLKSIVDKLNQKVNINKNEKITNQDARSITIGEENKKAGTLFFGKKGLNLPNGEYVSVEEINTAINQFINGKNELIIAREENKKEFKILQLKGKIKKFAATAAVAVSMLVSSINSNKQDIQNTTVVTNQENLSDNVDDISVNTINKLENSDTTDLIDNNMDIENQNLLNNSSNELNDILEQNVYPTLEQNMEPMSNNTEEVNTISELDENTVFENKITLEESKEEAIEEKTNNTVSQNEINVPAVSENVIVDKKMEDNTVSSNTISQNKIDTKTVSENVIVDKKMEDNTVSGNTISQNKIDAETISKNIVIDKKVNDNKESTINNIQSNLAKPKVEVVKAENIVISQPEVNIPIIQNQTINTSIANNPAAMLGITPEQLDVVKATIRHEAGNNPAEMANVASCIKNRMNSSGINAYAVVTAPRQFQSYGEGHYKKYTGGNYYQGDPETSAKVDEMLNNILLGITPPTHPYQSFRASDSPDGIQFENGGNKYR